jgi:hypothetical protein
VTDRQDRGRGRARYQRHGVGESEGERPDNDGAPTGGPGHTVPGGAVQTRFEIKSEFKWFETFSNCFKF